MAEVFKDLTGRPPVIVEGVSKADPPNVPTMYLPSAAPPHPTPNVVPTNPQPPHPTPVPAPSPQPDRKVTSGGQGRLLASLLGLAIIIGLGIWKWNTPGSSSLPQEQPTASATVTADRRVASTPTQASQAGESFVEDLGNGVKLEMVSIPSGTFTMGSPPSVAGREEREGPQHQVNVLGFLMGKTEVTQAQWRAVMGTNPSDFRGDDLPVEKVSWIEAKGFCRRLSARTGREYRLPSEAEWEYACRAGTSTPFSFGETISPAQVKCEGYSAEGKTVAAGSLPANPWGLHEMHGNVWEWCEDVWHDNYGGAPSDGAAWLSGGDSRYRVLRGGSWGDDGRSCRSAYRGKVAPNEIYLYSGFRVVAVSRTQ